MYTSRLAFVVVFCGYSNTPGPHPLNCLTEFWLEAGCSASGTGAPAYADSAQLAYWNSGNVWFVKYDMAAFYGRAVDGHSYYIPRCLG